MVLRRPYAFLIRYFRLIHLIIAIFLGLAVSKYRQIYGYLNSVISSTTNRLDAAEYTNYIIFLFIFLAVVLSAVVFMLLKYKDKPRRIYIIMIAGYGVVSVLVLLVLVYMGTFINNIPDTKTIRLYRDIMLIVSFFQYAMIVVMIIRGLGFDIKKFDFNRDMQELNATESDSAEVEINTQIDTTNIARRYEKGKREFGYFLKEYKVYVIAIIAIIAIILCFRVVAFLKDTFKTYHENQYVGVSKVVSITESYYKVENDKIYVIVDFDAFVDGKRERLNPNSLVLHIGRKKYLPDRNICHNFISFGTCYKKQLLTRDATNYMVTYEVNKLNLNRTYIDYTDGYDNTYRIKLAMKEA